MSVTPSVLVSDAWSWYKDLTNEWISRAGYQIDIMGYLGVAPQIDFTVPADITVDYGTFLRPTAPTEPTVPTVNVTLPDAPALVAVTVAAASEAAPVEPAGLDTIAYAKPSAPNRAVPARPSDTDVVLDAVVVPDAPTYTMPADPTLLDLNFPEVPDLTIPTFDGVRPDMVLDLPQQTFAWQFAEYDQTLIATIQSQLSSMTLNGLALPPAVEQAIFDRQRGREDIASLKAVQEATDDLAARGIRQPAGLAARALERIRAVNRQTTSAANRELSISIAGMNVEAVKFAIAQAISLEVALVQNNLQKNDLALRAAQAQQAVVIDLFNARVTLHNAQWEGYKADAQVFESRIRGIQAEADVYKAQIDAQKVIGDVNESLVRAYGERMRAIGVLAEFYRTSVDAARAKGELNTQKLEQARLRIQTWSTDIEAWGKEWDGYRTSVEAELGNVRAFETLGNVYGRRIDAWKAKRGADFDEARIAIDVENQKLERYRALLTGSQIDSQVQLAAVDAILRKYTVQGSIYAAEGQMSAAESASHDRTASLRIEAARLSVETANANNKMRGDYALKAVDQAIEANRAKATILAQLASSTMSGVNFGASISGSLGVSNSYSVGYSGDAENAPSWPLISDI
jgi:hypothetical protein